MLPSTPCFNRTFMELKLSENLSTILRLQF